MTTYGLEPPPLYVNGFPKAGLHLAMNMVRPLYGWADKDNVWYATNSWTRERYILDKAVDRLGSIKPGTMLMGHTGYLPELHQLFDALQIAMVLVYRDLRDVAVSQTYHILDDKGGLLRHTGRDDYSTDKREALLQVIQGLDEWPSVIERWGQYEQWLGLPFVFPVRFEDMVKKPRWVAKRFFQWIYSLALSKTGEAEAYLDKELQNHLVKHMVLEMGHKESSTTYRRGKTGEWKREFRSEHVRAFKATDKDNALVRLGYANQPDW